MGWLITMMENRDNIVAAPLVGNTVDDIIVLGQVGRGQKALQRAPLFVSVLVDLDDPKFSRTIRQRI